MPTFLDFVFPFGQQVHAQDFHFSGLREDSRLGVKSKGVAVPELDRSGTELQFCYNLRSVEQTSGSPGLPWSIRQSAIYHSFDLKNGRAVWISVKGNKLIKNRILEASSSASLSDIDTPSKAFSASLATHLLLCDWSGENWRWYINDLENQLRDLTRNALATPVDKPPTPPATSLQIFTSPLVLNRPFSPPSRKSTMQSPTIARTKTDISSPTIPSRITTLIGYAKAPIESEGYYHSNWTKAGDSPTLGLRGSVSTLYNRVKGALSNNIGQQNPTTPVPALPLYDQARRGRQQAADQRGVGKTPPELPSTVSEGGDERSDGDFTFGDLQQIVFVEEKAQEASLVLGHNVKVLEELRQHYQDATNHKEFPIEIKNDIQDDLARFDKYISGVKKDLHMMQSRTENLMRLLTDRKNLVSNSRIRMFQN
jgi:hypothetical protein